jgi:uncharacterized protein (DUF433 family)
MQQVQMPKMVSVNDTRDTELIIYTDPRSGIISIDPERHSGAPCFAGTRVPVQDLWDYLIGGENLDSFLESFPSVSREKAIKVMELAAERLLDGVSGR